MNNRFFRRMIFCLLVWGAVAWGFALTSTGAEVNLIKNGSFEETGGDGMPVDWQITKKGDPKVETVADDVHSGSKALFLEGFKTADAPPGYPTAQSVVIKQTVPDKPNTDYTISLWYKEEQLWDQFIFFIFDKRYDLPHTKEWKEWKVTANSGSHSQTTVMLNMYQRTGKVWLDDVKLIEGETKVTAVETKAVAESKVKGATLLNDRQVYLRGEEIEFRFKLDNLPADKKEMKLIVDLNGFHKATIDKVKPGEYSCKIPTIDLRSGEYMVDAWLMSGAEPLVKFSQPVFLAKPPNPNRLPVNVEYVNPQRASVRELAEIGYTMESGGYRLNDVLKQPAELAPIKKELDEAARYGIDAGLCVGVPYNSDFLNGQPGLKIVAADGKPSALKEQICPHHSEVKDYCIKAIDSHFKPLAEYPALKHVHINSEVQLPVCHCPDCLKMLKDEVGIDIPKFTGFFELPFENYPANGIVPPDDPGYKFLYWWWKKGEGTVQINSLIAKRIKEIKPDILTWHDPYRMAVMYNLNDGLDCISTWTYNYPDPKMYLYGETLNRAAKASGQKVMHTVDFLWKAGWVAPKEEGCYVTSPDMTREAVWIALSRRPDILGYYCCSHLLAPPPGWKPIYDRYDLRVRDEVKSLSETLIKPIGPALLKMKTAKRSVAVLDSVTSRLYHSGREGWWGYQIYDFYSILSQAHIPADVIFEDSVMAGELDNYKTLILSYCEVLPEPVLAKINEFIKKGGKALVDQYCQVKIPSAQTFVFAVGKKIKVSGTAADTGISDIQTQPVAPEEKWIVESVNLMRKTLFSDYNYEVDADSIHVLFNVLEAGEVKYIFVINDLRKASGKFLNVKDVGLPQKVTVRLGKGGYVVYDMMSGKQLHLEEKEKHLEIALDLPPAGGTILALYPQALKEAQVEVNDGKPLKQSEKAAIKVRIMAEKNKDISGVQPIYLEIIDPLGRKADCSDYYVAEHGRFSLDFMPALNEPPGGWKVRLEELTSGLRAEKEFFVAGKED